MALRIQFFNNKIGSKIIEIADPIGINELTQNVKRSNDNEGILFQVIFDLEFPKDGRRYLKQCFEQAGGIDAVVLTNIYELDPNLRRWRPYSYGKVNYQKFDVYEDRVVVNIEQTGFQSNVLNQIKTPVNLETLVSSQGFALPPIDTWDVLYHSKTIVKETLAKPTDNIEYQFLDIVNVNIPNDPVGGNVNRDFVVIGSIDNTGKTLSELTEVFDIPFGYTFAFGMGPGTKLEADYLTSLNSNKGSRSEQYRATEAAVLKGSLKINVNNRVTIDSPDADVDVCGSGNMGNAEINYWFEHRDKEDNIITIANIGRKATLPCGTLSFPAEFFEYDLTGTSVAIGDKIYVYETFRVWGSYDQPTGLVDGNLHHNFYIQNVIGPEGGTTFQFIGGTSTEATTAKTVLLHDAFERCCQYITGQVDCFKSDLLGRVERGYAVDGAGALIGWTNGGNLRKLEDKSIFAMLQDLIDFANSLFCVGFGFETVNGITTMRLELREFFYNKNNKVIHIGKVYNIKRTLDPKAFYSSVEYGYSSKLDIGQTNAIDEFNTARTGNIPIMNSKNVLKIATKVIAGGYQIEAARRLQFSTADGKLDDDNFAIVLIRDGMGGFRSKRDEGYAEILNVVDPATGYNYDISPARNFQYWKKFIRATLIRSSDKSVKFGSGTVNYKMATRKVGETELLYENGNFDLTDIEPDFEPFKYTFEAPITRDAFRLLKQGQNPYGIIGFSDQWGTEYQTFVSDEGLEHDQFKGKASFSLLHAYIVE